MQKFIKGTIKGSAFSLMQTCKIIRHVSFCIIFILNGYELR